MRLILVLGMSMSMGSPHALGQGGALPKGDTKKLDSKAAAASAPGGDGKAVTNCFAHLGQPPGGNGVFSADGAYLYFLATRAKKGKQKSTLYRVTLVPEKDQKKKAELLLSVDYRPGSHLITYGDPVNGVSIVSYAGRTAACAEGPAKVVSVLFAQKGGKAVHQEGELQIVLTPKSRALVDMKKQQILKMDTASFQTKSVRKVPPSERPLWYDEAGEKLVTFLDSPKGRGLVRYEGTAKPKRLAVLPKDRVLQTQDKFAAARLDTKGNAIELQEIAEWSGVEKPAKHKLAVPEAYPVAAAAFEANFAKRTALVSGGSAVARQEWQKVFLYDYVKPEPLGVGTLPGRQYFSFTALDPTGALALLEVKDAATRETVGLKVFTFATKRFEDVTLPPP